MAKAPHSEKIGYKFDFYLSKVSRWIFIFQSEWDTEATKSLMAVISRRAVFNGALFSAQLL